MKHEPNFFFGSIKSVAPVNSISCLVFSVRVSQASRVSFTGLQTKLDLYMCVNKHESKCFSSALNML